MARLSLLREPSPSARTDIYCILEVSKPKSVRVGRGQEKSVAQFLQLSCVDENALADPLVAVPANSLFLKALRVGWLDDSCGTECALFDLRPGWRKSSAAEKAPKRTLSSLGRAGASPAPGRQFASNGGAEASRLTPALAHRERLGLFFSDSDSM